MLGQKRSKLTEEEYLRFFLLHSTFLTQNMFHKVNRKKSNAKTKGTTCAFCCGTKTARFIYVQINYRTGKYMTQCH